MKASEAPEKLYLFENIVSGTPDDRWLSKRSGDEDIEYTRTDAFIKKAILYLIYNTNIVHYPFGDIREFKNNNFDEMLKDFENHMKV